MSTQTVSNRYFAGPGQSLPPDCVVLEMKYCELCGCPFSRKFSPTKVVGEEIVHVYANLFGGLDLRVELRRSPGIRYCPHCIGRALLPNIEEQEAYKAQLPGTPNQMRHSTHLPKYDDSLLPIARQTRSHSINKKPQPKSSRRRHDPEEWLPRVKQAFAEKGRLKAEDLVDLIPGCFTPMQAYQRCYFQDLPLKIVAREKIPGIPRGRGKAIYEWEGVSPIHQVETLYLTARESLNVH